VTKSITITEVIFPKASFLLAHPVDQHWRYVADYSDFHYSNGLRYKW